MLYLTTLVLAACLVTLVSPSLLMSHWRLNLLILYIEHKQLVRIIIIIVLFKSGQHMVNKHKEERTDVQTDRVKERKKCNIWCTIKHSKTQMLTDKHIEVVSPYHCYVCSTHTGRTSLWITVSNDGKREEATKKEIYTSRVYAPRQPTLCCPHQRCRVGTIQDVVNHAKCYQNRFRGFLPISYA